MGSKEGVRSLEIIALEEYNDWFMANDTITEIFEFAFLDDHPFPKKRWNFLFGRNDVGHARKRLP
ncbi:hypothetical protein [Luteibaculum oceani]|uniref:Uncharacterized protein n=1 Tax=Luteibaculum oceani TaxID=1294296 RepID=A0A5C6UXX0_9FLAO|nr:hypothetical protein [Luteibaculum oceani]TXC77101.1 hypothetical protein FRX97_09565 [Luteibaculum oceani]